MASLNLPVRLFVWRLLAGAGILFCGAALYAQSSSKSARMEQIKPPRELRLALNNAIKARRENEVAQLALNLGALMEGLARTDYLIDDTLALASPSKPTPVGKPASKDPVKKSASPSDQPNGNPINRNALNPPPSGPPSAIQQTRRPLISMRGRVEQLVEQLSSPQRESFEALYGAKAATALDSAIEHGDDAAIEEVAHRWRFTEAGFEAALVLARLRLDARRFAEAGHLLSQLRDSKSARQLLEPELSSLLVSALWLGNNRQAALQMVDEIAEEGWVLQRTAEPWRQALSGRQTVERLTALLGDPAKAVVAEKPSWPMFLGGSQRLGQSPRSQLPSMTAWRQELVEQNAMRAEIEKHQMGLIQSGARSLPAAYPTIVGDRVIVRTPERLVSFQLKDGLEVWSYPFDFRDKQRAPQSSGGGNVIRIQGGFGGMVAPVVTTQQNTALSKVWGNNSYGRLSATARYSFVIDGGFEVPTARQQQLMVFGARGIRVPGRTTPTAPKVHNRLTAVDLQREGAVAWVVGGETGEMNSDLKGVFFLGPPLPVHDRLYVLYERSDIVHLGVLDAKTGATEWTLQLAPVMAGASVNMNRRWLGAAPSLAEGVLICPTTVGGLMAIDIARRQFLWGWAPATTSKSVGRAALAAQLRIRLSQSLAGNANGWVDSPIVIQGDAILHSAENGTLYCLERRTGKQRWKRPQQDAWFLACADAERALLVGRHRYTAVKLIDGKAAWPEAPFRAIPAGGVPTGRGFSDGQAYYLPTSEGLPGDAPELLRIELASGATQRRPLERRLGNLASTGEIIISAGPAGIEMLSHPTTADAFPANLNDSKGQGANWSALPIAQLIKALDADDFDSREGAVKELAKRGADAVDPLGVVARSDSPEAARRALAVLVAINKLGVKHPNLKPILDEASRASNGTGGIVPTVITKRKRAIAALLSLGATVQNNGEGVILSRWRGKPQDLKYLKDLPDLQQLLIIRQPKANEMITFISSLKNLQVLNLQRSDVTDDGLAALTNLPKLKHLDISHSSVSDVSVDKLATFTRLQTLVISSTKITNEGRKRLQTALPKTNVTDPTK